MEALKTDAVPMANRTVWTDYLPPWIVSVAIIIMNGTDTSTPTGVFCDVQGNLIYYRKIGKYEISLYPQLGDVNEVWLTFDFPSDL